MIVRMVVGLALTAAALAVAGQRKLLKWTVPGAAS
jgi:hypothetical protein